MKASKNKSLFRTIFAIIGLLGAEMDTSASNLRGTRPKWREIGYQHMRVPLLARLIAKLVKSLPLISHLWLAMLGQVQNNNLFYSTFLVKSLHLNQDIFAPPSSPTIQGYLPTTITISVS